ncbi:DUF2851 family protein [Aggregatimonas sangjinii]|uniref:DUF2851 family protein n=1 Tax=Aggregatimonas sangjinii TaxID=2583587 RepID=A0A5B7SMA3_9FLAO|nr:DUF2851 family protein [Aggregatimonas sangjinii]QCW99221.1 DUF2851 family protein [Aggregatimonas sangjinii]
MKEDLLHFIWKYKKLQLQELVSSKGEQIRIIEVGTHNYFAGPDFFNSKVEIDGQLWAGNVEVHLNSSDWYAHHHEQDPNYNNVILHVVWEDDATIFRSDNTEIPTLQLKNFISAEVLDAYRRLFDKSKKSFINCENDIGDIDDFTVGNWLERLYFERLERKSEEVTSLLEASTNDWEQVLFSMLLKNFGLNINGEAFLSLAQALNFSVVRKLQTSVPQLESVFFGMSHLLEEETVLDAYYIQLKKEFDYQRHKFELKPESVQKPEFFRLRPPNFPTIRLSQLANLYSAQHGLFHKVMQTSNLKDFYQLFDISASSYWDDHFTFGKTSKKSTKKLTKKFIDLLLINTVLPLKFCYAKFNGKDKNAEIETISTAIKKEENSIANNFRMHGLQVQHSRDSQAVLELYKQYCTTNRCLECAIGSRLLGR